MVGVAGAALAGAALAFLTGGGVGSTGGALTAFSDGGAFGKGFGFGVGFGFCFGCGLGSGTGLGFGCGGATGGGSMMPTIVGGVTTSGSGIGSLLCANVSANAAR